jgi:hypothetical protein
MANFISGQARLSSYQAGKPHRQVCDKTPALAKPAMPPHA